MPMSLCLLPAILSISSSVSLPHCDRISPLSSFHLACRSLESICLFSFLKFVWLIVTDGLRKSQRTYHKSPTSFFLVHHYFRSKVLSTMICFAGFSDTESEPFTAKALLTVLNWL